MTGRGEGRGAPGERAAHGYPTAAQAVAILAVLVVATIFSYVDRTILSLLVAPIQRDMRVNDLQISYLLGPTFAIFFAVAGVPLGWAADRTKRLRLAAAGVAIWSVMTACSGLAHEFWQLFAARIGVAVGEAALLPTASSLVADCFPPRVRTRMLGVLGMSIYWGSGAARLFGGFLVQRVGRAVDASGLVLGVRPWQAVLILVGAPGLLIALALALLPEPRRQTPTGGAPGGASRAGPPRRRPIPTLIADYGGLFVAVGLMAVVGYGLVSWAPSHLVRAYGWSAGAAGVRLGGGVILAATLFIGIATSAADRLAARGHAGAKYLVAGWCTAVGLLLGLALGVVHDAAVFVTVAALAMGAAAACIAMGPAAVVDITPPEGRGRALGAYQTAVGMIGAGVGPPAVALAARFNAGTPGGLGVGLSVVVSACFLVSAMIFWTRRGAYATAALGRAQAPWSADVASPMLR